MKTLVFETSLSGHRLEYIHHIYMSCQNKEDNFVFVLPDSFYDVKDELEWPFMENVKILLIAPERIKKINSSKNKFCRSYYNAKLLMEYAREERINSIVLIMFMSYMPWLAFYQLKGIKIRGIIYKVFLYDNNRTFAQIMNLLLYSLFSRLKSFEKIFVLNDSYSAKKFNKMFHTKKFMYLPDPVPYINKKDVRNIRKELGVQENQRVFIHFGGLDERKGTLIILQAIKLMDTKDLEDKVFVFAGVISASIRDTFYSILNEIKPKARIIVYDMFCSYSLLNNLCESCDVILIPYSNTSCSSGVIGYASCFKKPVIGPDNGLLGELIKKYNLGIRINKINAQSLAEIFCCDMPRITNIYYKNHTVNNFIHLLMM